MLKSVSDCQTVVEMNRARLDLINQLFKRGITLEEFGLGYEYLFQHAQDIGLKFHAEYRTYGPIRIGPIQQLVTSLKYARFVNQFNQGAEHLRSEYQSGRMTLAQYEMCWTMLLAGAGFQGYEWNQYQNKFYEN